MKFTYQSDRNLDGVININDFVLVQRKLQRSRPQKLGWRRSQLRRRTNRYRLVPLQRQIQRNAARIGTDRFRSSVCGRPKLDAESCSIDADAPLATAGRRANRAIQILQLTRASLSLPSCSARRSLQVLRSCPSDSGGSPLRLNGRRALLAILLLVPATIAAGKPTTLTVVSDATGRPIAGATIGRLATGAEAALPKPVGVTDAQGRLTLNIDPAEWTSFVVESRGLSPQLFGFYGAVSKARENSPFGAELPTRHRAPAGWQTRPRALSSNWLTRNWMSVRE